MPVIEAKRSGPCAACGGLIRKGELIDFTREAGARHVACAELPSDERTNRHPAECVLCRFLLAKGQGSLELVENRQDGTNIWRVTCKDAGACAERRGIP
jgi:hypothetical protein